MKISVCLATYNGIQFVKKQLDSVLIQLRDDDQVIVVDDRSNDGTVQYLKDTYGDQIEVYVNEQNLGPIKSFEKAISLAARDIIFLCDQDDIWLEHKVEKVLAEFKDPNVMLAVHDSIVVDGDGNTINSSWNAYNQNNVSQGIIGNIVKNAFTGCMMAFRKEIKNKILPFPDSIEMHDQWIVLVCKLNKGKVAYIKEPLMQYVRHGKNVTGMKRRSPMEQLNGRLGTIKAVLGYRK
ncbi:glycosyltransferase [Bacillus sp. 1P02SD]|uniref:glycosyltransferase n=1 Tax=Bacillus sp. 1P02SD TaxID=3132264 RepID=UPI0039A3E79D